MNNLKTNLDILKAKVKNLGDHPSLDQQENLLRWVIDMIPVKNYMDASVLIDSDLVNSALRKRFNSADD